MNYVPNVLGVASLLLALCANSNADRAPAEDGCLDLVRKHWEVKHDAVPMRIEEIEKSLDRNVEGKYFSCELIASPLDAFVAFSLFQQAILSGDFQGSQSFVAYPFEFIWPEGEKTIAEDEDSFKAVMLDPRLAKVRALVSETRFSEVKLRRNMGFYLGDGTIWFQYVDDGRAIKLVVINVPGE